MQRSTDSPEKLAEAEHPATPPARLVDLASESAALRRAAALNPSAPASLLARLARHPDRKTRAKVAQNPNTPTPELLALSSYFSEEFLSNPALPLLLVEQPWLFVELRRDVVAIIASAPFVSKISATIFTQHKEVSVRAAAAGNPALPKEELENLCNDHSLVRMAVASNPEAPVELLARLAQDNDYAVRGCVGENPSTPETLLFSLAEDTIRSVREKVASNPSTPPEVLRKLAGDFYNIKRAVVKNQSTPEEILTLLSNHADRSLKISARKRLRSLACAKMLEDIQRKRKK